MTRRELLLLAAGALASRISVAQTAKRGGRLGLLLLLPQSQDPFIDPLFAALNDHGWSVGRNLHFEARSTATQQDAAAQMARELIAKGANILVTVGTANAVAAKEASRAVPIVMLASGYPVESGLAMSLAKPGGNVTGLTVYAGTEIFGKHVAAARELVPSLRDLGVFWGYAPPAYPQIETEICLKEMRRAADDLNIRLRIWLNRDQGELDANLAEAAKLPLQAMFLTAGGPQSTAEGIGKVAQFCQSRHLPAIADINSAMFRAAAILAHAPDINELATRGASFVDRILRGAKPGELPIEHPTRYHLYVNVKRAKAAGVKVPASILARADRVIE